MPPHAVARSAHTVRGKKRIIRPGVNVVTGGRQQIEPAAVSALLSGAFEAGEKEASQRRCGRQR